ncbi:hypothetical protein ABPG72_006350 [Tetrahymena utriculariae]
MDKRSQSQVQFKTNSNEPSRTSINLKEKQLMQKSGSVSQNLNRHVPNEQNASASQKDKEQQKNTSHYDNHFQKSQQDQDKNYTAEELQEMYSTRKEALQKHMDKLFVSNNTYFKLMKGGLVCGYCHRPKDLNLDYKKGAESNYQKDYKPHACCKGVPRVRSDFFGGFYTQQPMELTTVNRTDYIPHPLEKNKSEKKPDSSQFLPFAGVSSYNDQYANWGSNPVSLIKPPYHPTVIKELPFVGKTMYKDYYQGKPAEKDAERDKIIQTHRRGQFKSPINSDFPFLSATSYGTTYIPQNTSTNNFKVPQKASAPLPSFDGQYVTNYKKDYDDKSHHPSHKCDDKNCIICGRLIHRQQVM